MSDEDRAREIAEHAGIDLDDYDLFIAELSAAFAAVRAGEIEAIRARCAAFKLPLAKNDFERGRNCGLELAIRGRE